MEPKRSTFCMSIPMLQETTASAVMAVSHSLTSSTSCPASNFAHSPTKARVLAKICGAKLFTLIWLKPRGRRLWPVFQSSDCSLLVNSPLAVKSFRAGNNQEAGDGRKAAMIDMMLLLMTTSTIRMGKATQYCSRPGCR